MWQARVSPLCCGCDANAFMRPTNPKRILTQNLAEGKSSLNRGTCARAHPACARHPNRCSSHRSQCLAPKHHSLLQPRHPNPTARHVAMHRPESGGFAASLRAVKRLGIQSGYRFGVWNRGMESQYCRGWGDCDQRGTKPNAKKCQKKLRCRNQTSQSLKEQHFCTGDSECFSVCSNKKLRKRCRKLRKIAKNCEPQCPPPPPAQYCLGSGFCHWNLFCGHVLWRGWGVAMGALDMAWHGLRVGNGVCVPGHSVGPSEAEGDAAPVLVRTPSRRACQGGCQREAHGGSAATGSSPETTIKDHGTCKPQERYWGGQKGAGGVV